MNTKYETLLIDGNSYLGHDSDKYNNLSNCYFLLFSIRELLKQYFVINMIVTIEPRCIAVIEYAEALGVPVFLTSAQDTSIELFNKLIEENNDKKVLLSSSDVSCLLNIRKRVDLINQKNNQLITWDSFKECVGIPISQVKNYISFSVPYTLFNHNRGRISQKNLIELLNGQLDNNLVRIIKQIEEKNISTAIKKKILKYKLEYLNNLNLISQLGILDVNIEHQKKALDKNKIFGTYKKYGLMDWVSPTNSNINNKENFAKVIKDYDELYHVIEKLKQSKEFYFDLINEGNSITNAVISVKNHYFIVPFYDQEISSFYKSEKKVLNKLTHVLEERHIHKHLNNAKNTMSLVKKFNININGIQKDISILAHIVLEEKNLSYSQLIKTVINVDYDENKYKSRYEQNLYKHKLLINVGDNLFQQLKRNKKWLNIYEEIDLPLVNLLKELQFNGLHFDQGLYRETKNKLINLEQKLVEEFSLLLKRTYRSSTKDDEDLLHYIGIKTNEQKVDSKSLAVLKEKYPFLDKIITYRKIVHFKRKYFHLDKFVNNLTGNVHPEVNHNTNPVSRIYYRRPCLLSINKEIGGIRVKKFLNTRKNEHLFISADYSQAEFRLIVGLSGEQELIDAGKKNIDLYRYIASKIFGYNIDDITDKQRKTIKIIILSIIYGSTVHGIAKQLNISYEESKALINALNKFFPKLKEYKNNLLNQAKQQGYIENIFGRPIHCRKYKNCNNKKNETIERSLFNGFCQGSVGDMIRKSMVLIDNILKKCFEDARIVIVNHDEIIVEGNKKDVKEIAKIMRECMIRFPFSIPLSVDLKSGKSLGELKNMKV